MKNAPKAPSLSFLTWLSLLLAALSAKAQVYQVEYEYGPDHPLRAITESHEEFLQLFMAMSQAETVESNAPHSQYLYRMNDQDEAVMIAHEDGNIATSFLPAAVYFKDADSDERLNLAHASAKEQKDFYEGMSSFVYPTKEYAFFAEYVWCAYAKQAKACDNAAKMIVDEQPGARQLPHGHLFAGTIKTFDNSKEKAQVVKGFLDKRAKFLAKQEKQQQPKRTKSSRRAKHHQPTMKF